MQGNQKKKKRWLCAAIWLQCSLNTNRTKLCMHVISVKSLRLVHTILRAHTISVSGLELDINTQDHLMPICVNVFVVFCFSRGITIEMCRVHDAYFFLFGQIGIGIWWCRFWLLLDALTGFHIYTDWRWLHLCKSNIIITNRRQHIFFDWNCVLIWRMEVTCWAQWARTQNCIWNCNFNESTNEQKKTN